MTQLSDFTIDKDQAIADQHEVVNCIREHGIVVIPSFLSRDEVIEIRSEIEDSFKVEEAIPYNFGRSVRLMNDYYERYKLIGSLFKSQFMSNVCDLWYGNKDTRIFNDSVFITHEYKTPEEIDRNARLHFDRLEAFKFFFYLTDCNRNSGAFSVVPGSHNDGHRLRIEAWKRVQNGEEYSEVKNWIMDDYPELGIREQEVVPVEGSMGTLIIFDTHIFHRGGQVDEGRERMVMRSNCRAKADYAENPIY